MLQRVTGHDVFESGCDPIEVTCLSRPDTGWRKVDANGHEHRWYLGDAPAKSYNPSDRYETPTLIWVKDGEEYYEDDDEPHDVGHLECRQCGEHIQPRYTADDVRQFIPGLRWFKVNGCHVSPEEFQRRYDASQTAPR